jgi:hypothetical protein
MTINQHPDALSQRNVQSVRARVVLGEALLSGGLALAGLGLASAAHADVTPGGPCDWVTTNQAASFLGGPVSTRPHGDEAGSVDMSCDYNRSDDSGSGVQTDLRVPGAFPVDAASQFALSTAENATIVDGLGVKAACRYEPQTTPPSTTLLVLLNGDRLYRATGWYGVSCDTLKQFAQTAIGRIGA